LRLDRPAMSVSTLPSAGPGGRIHVHIVAKLRREGSTLRASRSPRDLARFIRDALFEATRRLEAVAVAKFG
jgi:hypothetical protein